MPRVVIKGQVRHAIELLAQHRMSVAEIIALLEDLHDRGLIEEVPSRRAIERHLAKLGYFDDDARWTAEDADSSDAATVTAVLRDLIHWSEGRITTLTRGEAKWIVRVRNAAPSVPTPLCLAVARHYLYGEESAWPALDAYLAHKPWDSHDDWGGYFEAVGEGWIEPAPRLLQFDALKELPTGSPSQPGQDDWFWDHDSEFEVDPRIYEGFKFMAAIEALMEERADRWLSAATAKAASTSAPMGAGQRC